MVDVADGSTARSVMMLPNWTRAVQSFTAPDAGMSTLRAANGVHPGSGPPPPPLTSSARRSGRGGFRSSQIFCQECPEPRPRPCQEPAEPMRAERLGNLPDELNHLADASIEIARLRLGGYPRPRRA